MKKLLIFTDLDGTLLDHANYSWEAARPAMDELKRLSFPVIFNSSKTSVELIKIRHNLENVHPFISENGAVINMPIGYFSRNPHDNSAGEVYEPHYFGKKYEEIITLLKGIRRDYGFEFTGFHDMTDQEVASMCGFSLVQAADARKREATEPLIWQDSESKLDKFTSILQDENVIVVRGGRFFHVMSQIDKGNSLLWLKKQYDIHFRDTKWATVGLGDSYNDMRMLEVVDYPVLVSNPEITQPDMSGLDNLIVTALPGPAGWNEAIQDLINTVQ